MRQRHRRLALGCRGLRQAEVEHLHLVVRRDLDVGRLEVAVDDSGFVRLFERLGNLLRNRQRVA